MRRSQRVSSLLIAWTKALSSDLTATKPHYGGKSDSSWLPLNSCEGTRFFDLPIPLLVDVTGLKVSEMVRNVKFGRQKSGLYHAREARGISRANLSNARRISKQQLSRVENGLCCSNSRRVEYTSQLPIIGIARVSAGPCHNNWRNPAGLGLTVPSDPSQRLCHRINLIVVFDIWKAEKLSF